MEEPQDRNAIVAKDNAAIGALARFDLTELRFLAFCLSHCDSRNGTNRQITARVADMCNIFPSMDEKSAYGIVKRIFLSIGRKPAEFVNEKGEQCLYHWLTGLRYRAGEFSFCISAEMEPYLLGLKSAFTQYRLKDVYQFRSASTWKLYENLASWKTSGRWAVSLDDLRTRLGIAGEYTRWNNLHQRVIAPAISEINELSDLYVEYHKEKKGRQIIGLVFTIEVKKPEHQAEDVVITSPEERIERQMLNQGINAKTAQDYARQIVEAGKVDLIEARLPGIVARAPGKGGVVYIIGAIKAELQQMRIFDTPKPNRLPHSEALKCYQNKRRAGEECPVRQRGTAQKQICKRCLEHMPPGKGWPV